MIRLAGHVALALVTLAGLAMLWPLRHAILLFLLSLAVAAALRPVADFFAERGLPKPLALAGALSVASFVIAAPTVPAMAYLLNDLQQIGEDALAAFDRWEEVGQKEGPLGQTLLRLLPPRAEWAQFDDPAKVFPILGTLFGVTFSFVQLLIDGLLVVVVSMYWTVDRGHFERLWLSLLPAKERIAARDVWRTMEAEVGSYCRSEVFQALATGLVLGTGYWLMGYPYPVLMAVLGGMSWLLPWVGMLIAAAAIAALSIPTLILHGAGEALKIALPVTLYTFFILLMMEFLIEPRLNDRRRFNTLAIAVITLALAEAMGLAGLLLGPPLAVAAQIVVTYAARFLATPEAAPVETSLGCILLARSAAVRDRIAHLDRAPQHLLGLVSRLELLVEEAQPILSPSGGESRCYSGCESGPGPR